MAELNIDIEKATQKIYQELHETGSDLLARRMAEQLKTYHPALFPIIEAWLAGEEREFEFEGISVAYIMEKQRCCYIAALSTMSALLEGTVSVESYKNRKFKWR